MYIQSVEKINFKIDKSKVSGLFNQTCLKENILPLYLSIYIYSILSPVKPELGVIPSGQEIIHE